MYSACGLLVVGTVATASAVGGRAGGRRATQPRVCRAGIGAVGGGRLHAARKGTVSGDARRPRRRVEDRHASQLAAIASALAEHGYTAVGDQLSARAAIHVSRADLRLPGRRALDAIARQRIQNRSDSASAGSATRPAATWSRCLGTLGDDDFTKNGVAGRCAERPVAGASWPAARRATSAICPPTAIIWPTGWAARARRSRTPIATHRRLASSRPTIRQCISFTASRTVLVPIASPTRMVRLLKSAGVTAEMYTVKDAGHLQAMFDRGCRWSMRWRLRTGI